MKPSEYFNRQNHDASRRFIGPPVKANPEDPPEAPYCYRCGDWHFSECPEAS